MLPQSRPPDVLAWPCARARCTNCRQRRRGGAAGPSAREEDTPAIRAAASSVSSGANPHSPVWMGSGTAPWLDRVRDALTYVLLLVEYLPESYDEPSSAQLEELTPAPNTPSCCVCDAGGDENALARSMGRYCRSGSLRGCTGVDWADGGWAGRVGLGAGCAGAVPSCREGGCGFFFLDHRCPGLP